MLNAMLWGVAVVCLAFALLCSFYNLWITIYCITHRKELAQSRRSISRFPLIPGFLGMLAVFVIPGSSYTKYFWIPLVVDITVPELAAGLMMQAFLRTKAKFFGKPTTRR
ncbi:MAG: hypothetical protein ABL309_07115 [Phycisphaerales bacterium]